MRQLSNQTGPSLRPLLKPLQQSVKVLIALFDITRRKKNSRNRDRSNNPNLHLLDVFKFGKNNRNLFGRQDPTQGNCQRHMLRVNFQDFNWQVSVDNGNRTSYNSNMVILI